MVINVIVQYNGEFYPTFLYGSIALLSYIITILLTMYYSVLCFVMFGGSASW